MTTQPTYHTTDPDTGSRGLSIHLHPSCLSYVLKDRGSVEEFSCLIGDDQAREFHLVSLSDWLTDHKSLFLEHHENLSIAVHSRHFHLVPDISLADQATFEMTNPFDPLEDVLFTDIVSDRHVVPFAVPREVSGLLLSHFEKQNICFGDRGFLRRLIQTDAPPVDGVYCQLMGQDITVGIVREGNMVFFNKYPIKNREDLLYYLLLCFQSNGLDAHADTLYLSGLIERESPMFSLVFDYIRQVELDNDADTLQYRQGATPPHAPHYFINLMHIR